ncbi:hypothetical protein BaRGS_00002853 [Batillaria attramentaria]|uniref:Uncharacterized protein n=1 Tax=Batillaria attramentaria TaxID=370345 RepID=A0ABD0M478_9CAEN
MQQTISFVTQAPFAALVYGGLTGRHIFMTARVVPMAPIGPSKGGARQTVKVDHFIVFSSPPHTAWCRHQR